MSGQENALTGLEAIFKDFNVTAYAFRSLSQPKIDSAVIMRKDLST